MLRDLSIRTDGTAAAGGGRRRARWAGAWPGHVRFPMRWLSAGFGQDELLGMAYVGEGIGRYFAGSTNGLDATSNIGLPGVTSRLARSGAGLGRDASATAASGRRRCAATSAIPTRGRTTRTTCCSSRRARPRRRRSTTTSSRSSPT